jgi:hypothetical protein
MTNCGFGIAPTAADHRETVARTRNEAQFRNFTCDNVVRALTATNTTFFDRCPVSGIEKEST